MIGVRTESYDEGIPGKNERNIKHRNNSRHQNDVMDKIHKRATWNTNAG